MAGVAAATSSAGAAPPATVQSPQAAASGASSGASFLAALGLSGEPAQAGSVAGTSTPVSASAAKPITKAAPASDSADSSATDAQQNVPATTADSGVMAWLLNLIAARGAAKPAASAGGAAPGDVDGATAGAEKARAAEAAAPGAALAQSNVAAENSGQAPNPATDPPALVGALVAAPSSSDAGAVVASAHAKAEAIAGAATLASEASASNAPITAPASATPAVPVPVPAFQGSFASLLAQAPDPTHTATPHTGLPAEVPAWPAALNEQVRWQIGEGIQEARLELHPRELGSVQVQLRLSASGAEVQFSAAHPQAREALQASLPQLRALLAADGLHLSQAQVGSQAQSQSGHQSRGAASVDSADAADEAQPAAPERPRLIRIGLVDDFA